MELAAPVVREALAALVAQVELVELAELVVRVAELEPSRVEGLELAPAVAGLELVPAVAELELALAVEAPETDHPHDHLALLRGIKSVTVALHRGLAPVLAGEDSVAAEAETTREPAAAEAVAAWVVAG